MSPSPTNPSSPLYKSHPLYFFRRFIIISAVIGILLHAISAASADVYTFALWIWGGVALLASGCLAVADLVIWAHQKHKEDMNRLGRAKNICRICAERIESGDNANLATVAGITTSSQDALLDVITRNDDGDGEGDDKPKWPVRWIVILDFLLTGTLCWIFLYEMFITNTDQYEYYESGSLLVRAWAIVPMGFSFVLHARCWWRQFRAKEKEAWIRGLALGIDRVRQDDDIEAGMERIVDHRGHHLASGCERNGTCGDGRVVQTSPAVQKGNGVTASVRQIVNGLNREAIQAFTSKTWLPEWSDTGERQSLLAHDKRPQTGKDKYMSDGGRSCVRSYPHVCQSVGARSHLPHVHIHGSADYTDNDDVNGNSKDTEEVKSIAIDRTATYLTPSDSGVTNSTSSTASRSSRRRDNGVEQTKKQNSDETDTEDEDVAAGSTLLSLGSKHHHVVGRNDNNDNDDDADIMVIKKAKKGKARAQKHKKGQIRENEFGT